MARRGAPTGTGPEHVVIGSGINALVAAAMLGKAGRRVLVLERADRPGGCLRTDELTLPGFRHDVMAATFVLFVTSPAFAALGPDLARHGLAFCHSPHPTGVLTPDGRARVLGMDRAANLAAMGADAGAFADAVNGIGRDAPSSSRCSAARCGGARPRPCWASAPGSKARASSSPGPGGRWRRRAAGSRQPSPTS